MNLVADVIQGLRFAPPLAITFRAFGAETQNSKPETRNSKQSLFHLMRLLSLILLACFLGFVGIAQTPSAPQEARAVLRLRVRVKVGDATKGLSRKRFFLTKGSREQNKRIVDTIERRPVVSRDCYYRNAGASEALIKWLKDSDCESVYCREIQPDDLEGAGAVPEFLTALSAGEKELGNRDLARKWLTVKLPEKLRDGFYKDRQRDLQSSIKEAEEVAGAKVLSVMTDRNGTAYFTELEPGTYTLSNILATELGGTSLIWNCEIQVKQDDRAFEKPYLISNRKDKNVKCVAIEKPLPVCEAVVK